MPITPATSRLLAACRFGLDAHLVEARSALDAGADIEHRHPGDGSTPLIFAMQARKIDLALLLIERGADLFAADDHGDDVLRWPAWRADLPTLALMLRAAAPDPTRFDLDRAFLAACESPDPDPLVVACLRALIAAGASIDARGDRACFPLGLAASRGGAERASFLVESGADPLAVDGRRMDAITVARLRPAGRDPELEAYLNRAALAVSEARQLGLALADTASAEPRRGAL